MRTETQILGIKNGPLWRIRCTQQEYSAILSWLGKHTSKHPNYSRLLVLAAAESLRRCYQGGAWAWEIIERAIPTFKHLSDRDLLIERGLKEWKCAIRLGRGGAMLRLSSLLCEGGIPPHLIGKEKGLIRQWCGRVLLDLRESGFSGEESDEELAEVAARQARQDQPSYLRDRGIYLLFGQLLGALWSLRRRLGEFPAEGILGWLDHREPDWRERLPLDLEDQEAVRLLQDLLITADRVERTERRPALQTWMEGERLWRLIYLPAVWTAELLTELFGAEPFRRRMNLIITAERTRVRVGQLVQQGADWRCSADDCNLPGDGELRLELEGGFGTARIASVLPGGRALPGLPRVFVEREGQGWRMIGTGNVRHPASPLRVMFPPGIGAPGVPVEVCGGCEVVEIREPLHWEQEGDLFQIVPGAALGEVGELSVEGSRFPWSRPGEALYLGLPAIYLVTEQGTRRKLKPEELRVRQPQASGWQPWPVSAEGAIRVQWVVAERVYGESKFDVLPPEFSLNRETLSPERFLLSSTHGWLGVPNPLGFTAAQDKGKLRLDVHVGAKTQPPARIDLRVNFGKGREAMLHYPFPLERDVFFSHDGRPVPAEVSVANLIRLSAEARGSGGRPVLCLKLKAQGVSAEWLRAFPTGVDGIATMKLSEIEADIRLMLNQSADLDATVKVSVLWLGKSAQQQASLLVRRYARKLVPQKDIGKLLLEPSPAEEDEVKLRAFRFLEPGTLLEQPRIKPGWQWQFNGPAPGTWLIVSHCNGVEFSRPVAWSVAGPDGAVGLLAGAMRHGVADVRRAEIRKVFVQMAEGGGGEEDWELLERSVASLELTDASALDTMQVLAEVPALAARLLFRLSDKVRDRFWQAMEGLPFLWALVGRQDWERALNEQYDEAAGAGEKVRRLYPQALERSADRIVNDLPMFDVFYQNSRINHGLNTTRFSMLQAVCIPNLRLAAIGRLQEMMNELLLRHKDHQWPIVGQPSEATLHPLFPAISLPSPDPNKPIHAQPVLMAPVVAAACAARGVQPHTQQIRLLQQLRAFDPDWFDEASPVLLALFLAHPNCTPAKVFA